MESIKGMARRATQSAKERFASADITQDERIIEVSKKIQVFSKAGTRISDKVTRVGRLFEELGQCLSDIAADYKSTGPVAGGEMEKLADEMAAMGSEVTEKSKEFHKILKENAFDPITGFLKELPKLKIAEDEQKRVQLEFDFFRNKVHDLRRNHQKDSTRIPRNEQILEKWRVDLHGATEKTKSTVSELYAHGLRVVDMAIFTVSQCTGNYSTYVNALANQHFLGAKLPIYPTAPILLPLPLPPSPFQTTPMPPGAGFPPQGSFTGPQPSQLNFGYDPNQQQQPQQQQWNQQRSGSYYQQPGQYPSMPPQQPYNPQQPPAAQPQYTSPPQGYPQQQGQFSPNQPQQFAPGPQQGQQQGQFQPHPGSPPQQQFPPGTNYAPQGHPAGAYPQQPVFGSPQQQQQQQGFAGQQPQAAQYPQQTQPPLQAPGPQAQHSGFAPGPHVQPDPTSGQPGGLSNEPPGAQAPPLAAQFANAQPPPAPNGAT